MESSTSSVEGQTRATTVHARLLFADRHSLAFDRVGVLSESVEEGELVKAGQVVARLRCEAAAAALSVAEARVENEAEVVAARKHHQSADTEYQAAVRANAAAAERGLSIAVFEMSAVDRMRLASEAAAAEIEKARKEHSVNCRTRDQTRAELEAMILKSPRDGIVTRAFKQPGEGVQAAEAVLEVLSIHRIRVEADIAATQAAALKPGDAVTVLVTFPGAGGARERFPTRLRFVDPSLERVSQTIRVWAELENADGRLREGLPTELELGPATAPLSTAAQ